MSKLKINLFQIFLMIGVLSGTSVLAYSQTTATTNQDDPITWLRNNRFTGNKQTIIIEYYEDPFYGIERVEKRLALHDNDFNDPYGARQGTGSGNGTGSGRAENRAPEFDKWIPYYSRPSNCATADYRPEINPNLLHIDAANKNRTAQIVYQPRPLYSKDDYLARRAGAIKLRVLLKADGTVGAVRPLTRLPGNLTTSAVRSACYLTFYPAVVSGKAVNSTRILTYTFNPEQIHEDVAAKYPPPPPATAGVKIISKPRPAYTPEAKQNQVQGTVTLRVTFLATGEIGAVVPIEKLADGLTEQSVEAAKQMRFEPAREKGRNVSQTKMVQYNFTLY